jgi:flagellar motor switch protein FliM
MSLDRVLSQTEIDSVFRNVAETRGGEDSNKQPQAFDFRRPDRIAKDQLRALHLLHETFARSLASSLSAYLRAYVSVNMVSVEQLSFLEFTQCLPSPTCMVSLRLKPYDQNAILELNPALVFPVLEMLLGGSGKQTPKLDREITEIEESILEGLFRIILNDLRTSWSTVADIEFGVDSHETEPSLLQILAPNEAIVTISIEVRVGDNAGLMNIGIPSLVIKMLRQKFDQQWSVRKTAATETENARILTLVKSSNFQADARLQGPTLTVENLLKLREGDILTFDYPIERTLDLIVNGKKKYEGRIVRQGRKRAFEVQRTMSE